MIWKWILLGLAAVLLLLLFCPVTLHLAYHEKLEIRLRVLGIPVVLYPRPAKKPRAPKAQKAAPAKAKPPEEKKPSFGAGDLLDHLDTVKLLLEQLERFCGRVTRAVTLHHLRLWMLVAGEDPAQTGIRFGRANAAAYGVLAILQQNFRVRDARLDIRPNFLPGGEEWAEGEGKLTACPAVLLWAVIRLAAGVLPAVWPLITSSQKQPKPKQPEEKAV